MKFGKKALQFLIGMIVLILIWQLVCMVSGVEEALFPSPKTVGLALIELIKDGILFEHIGVSLGRFVIGYSLAIIPAILLGMLLGRTPLIWSVIDPIVQVLRPISPVAWSPFIVLWFGIGNMPAIVIIFIAAFFPVLLTTVSGVRKVDEDYLKIAKNLEIGQVKLLYKVIFPATFPSIVSGLHLALGTSWVFLVAGEMVGAQSGLGFLIVDSRNTLNLANVLAGIVTIGVTGFILDQWITILEKWVGKQWGVKA